MSEETKGFTEKKEDIPKFISCKSTTKLASNSEGQSEGNAQEQVNNALLSGRPGNNNDNITDSSASSSEQEIPFLTLPEYQ
eukprot:11723469-Ditylum_brightwellii.AAC.1